MEEFSVDNVTGSDDIIQVVGRMTQFDNKVVSTRSAKDPLKGETKVTSMALAVFPIESGVIGTCINYTYLEGSNLLFNIDRSTMGSTYTGKEMIMYVFANMTSMPRGNGGVDMSLSELKQCAYQVEATDFYSENVGIPEAGFPMVGSVGDYLSSDGDGKHFVLMPSSGSGGYGLPTVDGVEKDFLDIPMDAVYAKYSFIISVESEQEIEGNYAPRFTMSGYEIHNIPEAVDFDQTTNDGNAVLSFVSVGNTSYAQGATNISFDFYIPERFVTPSRNGENFTYPFGAGGDIREEDKDKRQRYKPLLAQGYTTWNEDPPSGDPKSATFIKIKGTYRDHQQHLHNVKYDIYLGSNNYDNFDVKRNTRYVNRVHIKGIDNSNDQTDEENTIALDHRVDVETSSGLIINLRRETMLDAHFDIRPLRIRSADLTAAESQGTVKIEILEHQKAQWLRMEHNNGTGSATTTHCANGKRKYFTTDLVTNTLAGNTSITLSKIEDGAECIWIYADECTDVYAVGSDGKPVIEPRSATLRVTFTDGNTATKVIDYTISQSKLYPITITGEDVVVEGSEGNWTASAKDSTRNYYIESYEEYLYNFDAEDLHAEQQTQYEGMAWGLDGVQLSHTNKSLYVTSEEIESRPSAEDMKGTDVNELVARINNWQTAYYDFYVARHDSDIKGAKPPHMYNGLEFCNNIITYLKDTENEIGVLGLDEQPQSAVEYCYNKNKRNAAGEVVDVVWYLPAVDEIEDIMVGAYDAFDGVFQEQDYWSCQPSHHRNYFYYSQTYRYGFLNLSRGTAVGELDYYIDNLTYARSTKATLEVEDGNIGYSYNPSGVKAIDNTTGTVNYNGNNYTMTYQHGYYSFSAYRSGNANSFGDPTDPNATQYDMTNWWTTTRPILPVFDEEQEPGSMPRTEKNRVRCVRKATSQ